MYLLCTCGIVVQSQTSERPCAIEHENALTFACPNRTCEYTVDTHTNAHTRADTVLVFRFMQITHKRAHAANVEKFQIVSCINRQTETHTRVGLQHYGQFRKQAPPPQCILHFNRGRRGRPPVCLSGTGVRSVRRRQTCVPGPFLDVQLWIGSVECLTCKRFPSNFGLLQFGVCVCFLTLLFTYTHTHSQSGSACALACARTECIHIKWKV